MGPPPIRVLISFKTQSMKIIRKSLIGILLFSLLMPYIYFIANQWKLCYFEEGYRLELKTCIGDSITLGQRLQVPGFSYEWSNGDTTAMTQVQQSGTYTLVISGDSACTVVDTIELELVEPPSVDLGFRCSDL